MKTPKPEIAYVLNTHVFWKSENIFFQRGWWTTVNQQVEQTLFNKIWEMAINRLREHTNNRLMPYRRIYIEHIIIQEITRYKSEHYEKHITHTS